MPNYAVGANKVKQIKIRKLMDAGHNASYISQALEIEKKAVKNWMKSFTGFKMLKDGASVEDVMKKTGMSKAIVVVWAKVGADGFTIGGAGAVQTVEQIIEGKESEEMNELREELALAKEANKAGSEEMTTLREELVDSKEALMSLNEEVKGRMAEMEKMIAGSKTAPVKKAETKTEEKARLKAEKLESEKAEEKAPPKEEEF